ncbi:methylated-DNA--[protein]-cysteine S-methyltransferase [Myxococcota bacterium]|nr:methylated-DNA--[protein]-cysteine S-methyltransferase [Myxococcota bacterium]MBU1383111.1 methylated-DNA--[protein]-cysteine S-methyltransferase [Myxococcota bacterium]MBU1499066.1 methylated-DNA--[protein]-cysteine S-methyltransferase [Myxococcota bacterium]
MAVFRTFETELGKMTVEIMDDGSLSGLWFEGQRYFPQLDHKSSGIMSPEQKDSFKSVETQICEYIAGKRRNFEIKLKISGTAFQMQVWQLLQQIPWGTTVSYGELARRLAEDRKTSKMSARAIGGAVGKNPISIIIPCHRVIGSNGSLTGYAGGLELKKALLTLEKK